MSLQGNDNGNPMFSFHSVLKTQLLKILNDFVRELDLSFDYIDKGILNNFKKSVNECENNDILFKKLYSDILDSLKEYSENLKVIHNQKIRTNDILFLNNITLLNLSCNLFKDENKNTKKTLITFLNEFYNVSKFLDHVNSNTGSETMLNDIQKMVENLVIKPVENASASSSTSKKASRPNPQPLPININSMMENINNMDTKSNPLFNQLNDLIQNKDIMNIASELTSEIQVSDLDPMSIMSSLMSGNMQDAKINNLITSIGDKITRKLNTGEIDKNLLEEHANKFLNTISSNQNDLMSIVNNISNNK